MAPHDLAATLADMVSVLGSDRNCVVARELTKVTLYSHINKKQAHKYLGAWHSAHLCFVWHCALLHLHFAQLQAALVALGTQLWQHSLLWTLQC